MNLSTRLTLAMVSLVLITAAAIGIWSYRNIEIASLPTELARLDARAREQAVQLDAYVRGARADVIASLGTSSLEGLVAALSAGGVDPRDHTPEAVWRQRVAQNFISQLKAKPEYYQFRLMGVADNGREIVRVDRLGPNHSIHVVTGDLLRQQKDRTYFKNSIGLRPGEVYVASPTLNRDGGGIDEPHRPVLVVVTPVFAPDKTLFGILVINVDMKAAFDTLREAAPYRGQIYVVNERGEYLVHPDPSKEFGFDLGHSFDLGDSFPALVPKLGSGPVVERIANAEGEDYLATIAPVRLAGGPLMSVIATIQSSVALNSAFAISQTSLIVALLAVLFATAMAVYLARSIGHPLAQMTESLSEFTGDENISVSVKGPGEIGVLARAFQRMADSVRERTTSLEREIAERKRAEAAVEKAAERERLLAAVVASTSDAVLTTTLDGTITTWNKAAEHLFGYTADESLGRNISLIATPEQQVQQREIFEHLSRGGQVDNFETKRRAKDGAMRDVSLTLSPLRTADGILLGASSIMRDITERKRADEMFRLAVESAGSGMILTDAAGKIAMVNGEAERIFGYAPGELIGKQEEVLIPLDSRDAYRAHIAHYLQNPSRRALGAGRDIFGLKKDGSEFPIEVALNPIATSGGPMVLTAIVDITERKQHEEALAKQTAELKRSNAELEQFAYIASHDLQEPLRMVASYTELLSERYRGKLDERADKYIRYAVEGAKRMQGLVNDLLTFSRVGRLETSMKTIDAGNVLQTVLRHVGRMAADSRAEITSDPLPTVYANENELSQILQNLIGNALKFRAPGRTPHIHVSAKETGDRWVFSVADNGIGIEAQYSERIFQMFQRLHDRETYEGSGIGLSIAKKIVERHGGRIWFQSEPGHGTTFFFTLPANKIIEEAA